MSEQLRELESVMMKKHHAIAISALLIIANSATANALYFKCNLVSSRAANVPHSLNLLVNEDTQTVTWQADDHNQLLQASVSANRVTFRGPYTDTPSSLDRTSGALLVSDPKYRSIAFLCQFQSRP